jgi:hypothetical protein
MRKHGDRPLRDMQTAYNRYVIIVLSISDAAPELILDLYRQRLIRKVATSAKTPRVTRISANECRLFSKRRKTYSTWRLDLCVPIP